MRGVTKGEYLRKALILLGLMLVGLVLLNVVFSRMATVRWDLTAEGQYTLSPATVRLLEDLEAPLTVKVFLSKSLPPPDQGLRQRMADLLAEFEAAGHGRFRYEIIEPESKADEAVAKGFGIEKVAVSQRDESQRSLRLVFKGMTLIYRDSAETITELRSGDNLEYLMAKSIVNLTAPQQKRVGVLTGFGGLGESPILVDSMRDVFGEVFGKRVDVTGSRVDESCRLEPSPDVLVVLNLSKPLTPCAEYALEQAAIRGTGMAVLQSPTRGDYRQPDQPRIAQSPNLNGLLGSVGVTLRDDLLLDRVHNVVGTQYTGTEVIEVSQPALPIVTQLDKTHPVTQNLTALVFPFSGTLHLDERARNVAVLAQSAPESVSRPSGGDIAVDALMNARPDETPGPHALAVAIQAPQTSRFADALPEGAKPDDFLPGTEHTRYFVVSNGEFLFANKIIGYEEMFSKLGIHLFVNAIEWLMQDEALMGIRNRTLSQMVEKPAPEVQRRIILFNVVGVPAFVLLCMLGIRLHRRHRERQIQRRFAKLK